MQKIDFYSKVVRVSLQLPVGWEEFRESDNNVTYLYETEENQKDYSRNPRIIIAIFPVAKPDESILDISSSSLLSTPKNMMKKTGHKRIEVDECPGIEDIFTYHDPSQGGEVYHHNVFVLIDNVLYSFSMLCPLSREDEFSTVFAEAIDSVRFIFD
jgi:hypothetical protein